MNIHYIFRSQRKGVFSIEVLFSRIIAVLKNKISIKRTYVDMYNVCSVWFRAWFQSVDVYHITGDVNYAALGLRGRKTLLTIHDIGHYTQTLQGWKKKVYKVLWMDWPLSKAACITTVSEFSRQQLIEVFAVDPEKVKVVHNPYPATYARSEKHTLSTVPQILQIGSGAHKNLHRLIEAVKGISCELLLVRPYDVQLDDMLKEKGIACRWYFNLTDDEMYDLYVKCDIVFFASTYEGFGMPIIEAQAVGRAVVTSNVASMPEVGGEGVVLVDPYHTEEIRRAIVNLCQDSVYRNLLIEKGYQNLQRFQSATIAQQYIELYQQIINRNQ